MFALVCMRKWQIVGLGQGFFKTVLLPVTSDGDRSACEKEAVDGTTDFVQIVHGGGLTTTTELFESGEHKSSVAVDAEAKVGLGALLNGLLGARAAVGADASLSASFDSGEMAKSIIANTLLTDFLACVSPSDGSSIHVFEGYDISPVSNSMSSFMLLTPYLGMLRGGSSVSAGDFAISLDRIDDAIKKGRGYYEFLAVNKANERDRRLLRFNGSALKNNYKLPDLTKMDLLFYAVKVGKTCIADLDVESELEFVGSSSMPKNPDYPISSAVVDDDPASDDEGLGMYDVILAGVKSNDR